MPTAATGRSTRSSRTRRLWRRAIPKRACARRRRVHGRRRHKAAAARMPAVDGDGHDWLIPIRASPLAKPPQSLAIRGAKWRAIWVILGLALLATRAKRLTRSSLQNTVARRPARSVGKDVHILEAGQVEVGADGEELEAGLRLRRPALPLQHGVELRLQGVQMQDVGRRIVLLLVGQLVGAPVGALLLLGQLDAEQLAAQVLQAVAVGVGPDQLGGDLGAVDGGRA